MGRDDPFGVDIEGAAMKHLPGTHAIPVASTRISRPLLTGQYRTDRDLSANSGLRGRKESGMTRRKDEPTPRKSSPTQRKARSKTAETRQARLAAALRENLRRRKKGKPDGKPG